MYIATTALIFAEVYVAFVIQETVANVGNPQIISRQQWGARAAKSKIDDIVIKPAPYVIIHDSGGKACENQTACQSLVKDIQNFFVFAEQRNKMAYVLVIKVESCSKNYIIDMKNQSDLPYNFLIGEDGSIYEGRGWGKQSAYFLTAFNDNSMGICILGNYMNRTPNIAAVQAVDDLITYGIANGEIKNDYKLLAHRQIGTCQKCPGDKLHEIMQTWPHWAPAV